MQNLNAYVQREPDHLSVFYILVVPSKLDLSKCIITTTIIYILGIPIHRVPTSKKLRILHLRVCQVPSQFKDYLVEKASWMYHGCREDLVLIFLLLYKALYKSLKCPRPHFDWLTTVTPLGHTKILHVFSLVPIIPFLQLAQIKVPGESTLH